jgi:hypothetical protein
MLDAVVVWDARTGKPARTLARDSGIRGHLAYSPDGSMIAAGVDKGRVVLWEAASGRTLAHWVPHEGEEVESVAFSPDGLALATCSVRDTIRVWEVATGISAWQGVGQAQSTTSLAFLPASRAIVWGSAYGAIMAWDLAVDLPLGRLAGHAEWVTGLVCSPRRDILYSSSLDTTALAWDVSTWRGTAVASLPWPTAEGLQTLWEDLAADQGISGLLASWRLIDHPRRATALLRARLLSAKRPSPAQLAGLIADLEAPRFTARERAGAELDSLGAQAEAALRKGLGGRPSLEARHRIEAAVGRLTRRGARCVRALERIATPEAKALLADLAEGLPEARLTGEAKAALGRLDRRPGPAK